MAKDKSKDKNKTKKPESAPAAPAAERNAERRVAVLRSKLTQAMEDPLMRDQIVRAIRVMINEPK